jgi:hypothetical protein
LSCQLIRVDSVYITLRPDSSMQRLSPGEFDLGNFMFGTMLDLTTTPSTRSSATVWHQVPAYITPSTDNHIHDFIAPPREMLHFTFGAAVTHPLLVATRQATEASTNTRAHNYFYGYISNLLYFLEFTPTRTRENIILAEPVYGTVFACIEAILPGQAFPPNGVND